MSRISLEQANILITAAFAKGKDLGLKPLTIAVLDAGGHVIALQRQDGASNYRPQIAIGKANGALALGVSSRQVEELANKRPSFVAALGPLLPQGIIPAPGGIISGRLRRRADRRGRRDRRHFRQRRGLRHRGRRGGGSHAAMIRAALFTI